MKQKKEVKAKNPDLVPFGITFNGTIANSIARIFQAICTLFEGTVDWLIWKMQKSKQK